MCARGCRGRSARNNPPRLVAADRAVGEVGAGLRGNDRRPGRRPARDAALKVYEFITLVRDRFEEAAREGEAPVLVTSAGIRPFVRSIVERFRAQTPVMTQAEIHPRARLKTVGGI